ncbi:alkaline phosphatase family protein [Flavobacteriaceae bacterium F89]|uniref:Alkaline phosphatase family protein n=1 Tax=Cerina litoralis TaxID=2874477 RepID=A0AAE3JRL5_9FLAO|nr:alkaline phosphatase family protein [Cerina litoralis]MCG2461488.1 alkaline phosphatase family protein [Cerina litoralis]
MNKIAVIIFTLVCIQLSKAQDSKTKVLFAIVDGISADVIEKVPTPNLDAIAAKGGYTRAYVGGLRDGYSQTPTISAVGYNSLLTGTWVNKHHVYGNSIKAPNYNYWTIFRFAKENRPNIKTAIFSTWLDNRTKLVGEGLEATGNIKLDYHFDGFELDTVAFPHTKDRLFIHRIDEHVTDEAARYVKANGPDLSWVYLEFTDDMGHMYGDSEQFRDAIKTMDDQIGRIWEAIKIREKDFGENWQLWITTDHGRSPKDGKGHGGQSDRERNTWIVTNANDLNARFTKETPAIVDLMPSMLRALDIHPKKDRLWEIDGVPLTGNISVSDVRAIPKGDKMELTWKDYGTNEKLEIWMATTNLFVKGEKDKYIRMGNVNSRADKANVDVSQLPSKFYKIVLMGKYNAANTWAIIK